MSRPISKLDDVFKEVMLSLNNYAAEEIFAKMQKRLEKFVDTGALKDSFVIESSHHKVSIKSDLPYAATQNFGDPKRNIPAKKYVPKNLTKDMWNNILKKLEDKWKSKMT